MARYPDGSLDVDSQQSRLSVGHLQERSTRGDQSMVGEVLQCQSVDTTHRSVNPRARVIYRMQSHVEEQAGGIYILEN